MKHFYCHMRCDGPGCEAEDSFPAGTVTKANVLASTAGWGQARTPDGGLADLCPTCMDEHERSQAVAAAQRKAAQRRYWLAADQPPPPPPRNRAPSPHV